jgi:uncharacterized protein
VGKYNIMLVVISPAKTLDFTTPPAIKEYTSPDLLDDSKILVARIQKMSAKELSKLMGISADLGNLNYERYQTWHVPFSPENAKQAVLAFDGDVYAGLDAPSLPERILKQAQHKLRILSGLYGVLKPLDLIQPYRLEMGTKFGVGRAKDLYAFWGDKITKKIQVAVDESGSLILVNLASNEYYKSIDIKKLNAEIVTPAFKDMKNGEYKMISFFAKKARGLMTRFILENRIDNAGDLQAFDADGYHFNPQLSKPETPVFTRG